MIKRTPYSLLDKFLSLVERPKASDRLLLRLLLAAAVLSGLVYLYNVNNTLLINVPTQGGSVIEGIIGIPRFVNPALAITRADQDAVALLYSGLLKINPSGELVPDIAESITTSEDGRTYTIKVRKDRQFHDGVPITALDAVFTIELLRNPDLKGPLRGNWAEVTLETINEYEFTVTLNEVYTPFKENFTFGIMPRHIWDSLPIEQLPFSQYNTEPIGSGPFSMSRVIRDNTGLISSYVLTPAPYQSVNSNLSAVEIKFYQNEDQLVAAFNNNEINSTVFLPTAAILDISLDQYQIITEPLPRIFGIFINQNRSTALRDRSAREALSVAINRDKIIDEVLGGYGVPTDKPIVFEHRGLQSLSNEAMNETEAVSAESILTTGGWVRNELGVWTKTINRTEETLNVTIRTGNSDLFNKIANAVADDWRALGVEVQIEQYEQTGLVQSVIRSRDFQALLFGIDMNRTQDLYPFWHSSQKDDPGLNISQYTNISTDQLLEKARATVDVAEQWAVTTEISSIIQNELPAIFLFAPSIIYVVDKDISISQISTISKSSDRFMNITNWHAKTDTVWPIFQRDRTQIND